MSQSCLIVCKQIQGKESFSYFFDGIQAQNICKTFRLSMLPQNIPKGACRKQTLQNIFLSIVKRLCIKTLVFAVDYAYIYAQLSLTKYNYEQ